MSHPTPTPSPVHDAVRISGSVGAGKTTLAEALGEELERRSVPGAVVDVDRLRSCSPSPQGDPYRTNIATQNLRAVSTTFRAAGAQVIVAAGVIEDPAEVETQARALGASRLLLVRLVIDPSNLAGAILAEVLGERGAAAGPTPSDVTGTTGPRPRR